MAERIAYEMSADPTTFEQAFKRMQTAAQRLDSDVRKIAGSADAFRGMQGAVADFSAATSGLAVNTEAAKGALDHLNFSSSAVRREMIVLGHEMLQGNWSRFGGSLMVMGERMDILGAVFSKTGAAVAAAAAVVALATIGLVQGARESAEFEKSTRLTGEAAGITAGQMHEMAKQVAQLTDGRFAAAGKAVQAVVSSGAFTGDMVEQVAEVSTRIANLSGKSAEEVVKEFAKMTEGGKDFAKELNKDYNFLTPAQYAHIRKLQEQGKETEALGQTISLLSFEMASRTPQALGVVTRAWDALGKSMNWVGDSYRDLSRDKTLEEKLAEEEENLSNIKLRNQQRHGAQFAAQAVEAEKNIADLKKQIADRAAAGETDRQNQARIKAVGFVNEQLHTYASGAQKMKEEIEKFNREADLAGNLSAEQRAGVVQGIHDKFKPKGAQDTSAGIDAGEYLKHQNALAQIDDIAARERLDKKEITEGQYVEIQRQAEAKRYELERAELQKELALVDRKPDFYAGVNAKIEALQDQHAVKLAQISTAAAQDDWRDKQLISKLEEAEYLKHVTTLAQLDDLAAKSRLANHKITGSAYISIQRDAENQRYALEKASLEKELNLANERPSYYAEVFAKLESLQDQHQLKMAEISGSSDDAQKRAIDALANKWKSAFAPITQAFDQTVQGVIQGTQTWHQGMAKMFASVEQTALSSGLTMLGDWTAHEIARTMLTTAGTEARTGIEQVGALESIAISVEASIKQITISAYRAMAAAWASISAIPIYGPFLAPAIAAGTFAAVVGIGASIASASAGYDIPAGINPLTQLHASEMVLPAHIAQPLRESLADGGIGGGDVHVHIHAMDTRTGANWLMSNKTLVAAALKSAIRDGYR